MNNIWRNLRYDWPLHFVLLFTNWLPDNVLFIRLRGRLASPFFKKCGKRLGIGRNVCFYNPGLMCLGDDVYLAYGNWLLGEVEVGDQVLFGPNSLIVASNHTRLNGSFRFGKSKSIPIRIGKGVWVGGGCAILAGSRIDDGSLIGANTVVKGEVPKNVLFAGNPGVVKKKLNG